MSSPAVGRVGDWIEEPSTDGSAARRGLILEVLGSGSHRHYRVRWDEEHESIHVPSPAARIRARRPDGGQPSGAGSRRA